MTIASTRQDAGLPHVERLLADPAARPSGAALVGALAVDLDGAVLVLGPDGAVLARAGSAAGAHVAQRAVTAVGGGEPAPGAGYRDWSVRVWPLAADGARSLVAARRRAWTSPIEATAGRAATIIATALLADENDTERDRLVDGRRAVWGSVLQLLMTGQVAEAQRVAGALEPAILDVERVRVHVLAGRSRDRDALLGACEDRLAGLAVCVACPARSGHVVVIEPLRSTGPGTGGPAPVPAALSELTAGSASRSLGSSRCHPIAATAAGYIQAIGALAAAAVHPDRKADAEQSRGLTDLLPAAAGGWASAVLAPLAAGDEDGTLRHTLAVALTFTRAEAAAILGVHRNTVHARLDAAAELLGVDLARLPQRAAIDLALRAQPGAGEAGLPEVLGDPQLKIWAADLLDRLDGAVAPRGPARMRDLLRAFTLADGGITAAAYTVGLSPNSASRWLVAAEAAGGLRLRHGYGGAHEVAVALAAAEGLPLLPGH